MIIILLLLLLLLDKSKTKITLLYGKRKETCYEDVIITVWI